MPKSAIVQSVFDFAIREINALETRIVTAEDDADAMLWEQARQVVEQYAAGRSQQQIADKWINVRNDGEAYTQQHVSLVIKVFRHKHACEPRPRFREAYMEIAHASTRKEVEDANRAQLDEQIEIDVIGIYHGDFRDRYTDILPPESVQLVLTDPPYDEESVDLFGAAAAAAAHVLRPGGSLLVYSGQKHLGDVIAAMTPHLRYWWTFALVHQGPSGLLQRLGVRCSWKPILWFVKGTRGGGAATTPAPVDGSGREKDTHAWQQGEGEAATLIERFTNPHDLVVDFFAGSGTVLVAAKKLDRRFVGFETHVRNVEKIIERLT
jgi:16S rRNA G966 N2-methylase RsmD